MRINYDDFLEYEVLHDYYTYFRTGLTYTNIECDFYFIDLADDISPCNVDFRIFIDLFRFLRWNISCGLLLGFYCSLPTETSRFVLFNSKVTDELPSFLFMGEIISMKLLLAVCLLYLSRSSTNDTFFGVVALR